jgi:epoxyqueuosine reductase
MDPKQRLTEHIKTKGAELGFDLVGVSPVREPRHGAAFADWLRSGYHGEMGYLPRTAEQRLHPGELLPWARSIVSAAVTYDTPAPRTVPAEGLRGWISRYAWGEDYHEVVRAKLERLLASLAVVAGRNVRGRIFVDAGPVLDREAAAAAGIGWYGKNTNLLSMQLGSFFFLGELFLDLELVGDQPVRDRCGQCRLCLDACPTKAFVGPYLLDARRCISYLTIELKGPIPRELRPLIGAHIFGCDICQDVCPYNTRVHPSRHPGFAPREGLVAPELLPLLGLSEEGFRTRFRGSPIRRAKRRGLLRNVCVALGNLGRPEAVPALAAALQGEGEALIRGHAAWALGRIGGAEAQAALRRAQAGESDPWVLEEVGLALSSAECGRRDGE